MFKHCGAFTTLLFCFEYSDQYGTAALGDQWQENSTVTEKTLLQF